MAKIKIDKGRCKGCKLCVVYCPKSCIKLEEKLNKRGVCAAVFLDDGKCTGCTFCALICPDSCIIING
ncbi:MAG: 4Fe-4S binding protein [Candidatus Omnitrophota bacterium]